MAVFDLELVYVDAFSRLGRKSYQVEATDFTEAGTLASAFLTDLTAALGFDLLRYTIGQETTYSDVVEAGANKDEGITVTFLKQDNKKASVKFPCPLKSAYVNGDGTVDMTDSLIVSLMAHFVGGPVYISDGEIAQSAVSGKLDV